MRTILLSSCIILGVNAIFAANLRKTEHVQPGTNVTESIRRALHRLSGKGGGTLALEPGDYHLYASEADRIPLAVSNHDQPADHPVPLPLIGVTNLTVEGNGARLLLHGEAMACLIMNATNVVIRNLSVDWVRPPFSELVFQGLRNGQSVFSCDRKRYPFTIRDGVFVACGDGLDIPQNGGMAFRADTGEIVPGSADIWYKTATKLPEGDLLALDRDFTAVGDGLRPGDIFVVRSFYRPHPAFCLHRSKDVAFEDVVVHAAFGMAFLAQMSENVSLIGSKTAADKTCGVFPASGRIAAHTVDATHFSNVKGRVRVKNSWFEGMMDDAINVHSTCLAVHPTSDRKRIRCRYMHDQAFGFGVFAAGDKVRFIRGKTLENGPVVGIVSVRTIDSRELELTLAEPLPDGYGDGDAVENATYQCSVEFKGNVVTHNRARGALFTTPLPVRIEDNQFLNVSGSAILFAGDAMNWYESGACEDVIIRHNLFRNCMTSHFQYCEGVISIFPEIREVAGQTKRYHRNILIEKNTFDTFATTLLFAISADNLRWRKNTIRKNTRYPDREVAAFRISNSERVDIRVSRSCRGRRFRTTN